MDKNTSNPENSGKPEKQVFNLEDGEALKKEGMENAVEGRKRIYGIARSEAVKIALSREDRTVTADDVQEALVKLNYQPAQLGNAAGSIFRGDDWDYIGHFKSIRKSNHARRISKWRYNPKAKG